MSNRNGHARTPRVKAKVATRCRALRAPRWRQQRQRPERQRRPAPNSGLPPSRTRTRTRTATRRDLVRLTRQADVAVAAGVARRVGGETQTGDAMRRRGQGELSVPVKGLLDLREEGYGFLRTSGYLASVEGRVRLGGVKKRPSFARFEGVTPSERRLPPGGSESEKYPALMRIDSVSGMKPRRGARNPRHVFEDLTATVP